MRSCLHCSLRVVAHRIGNGVIVWVHLGSNSIWCWKNNWYHTARPRWARQEKWNDA